MKIRQYLRTGYRALLPLLYGRSRYKLFMKTSLEEVDYRVRLIASLSDLYSITLRPVRITAPFGDSMLVIAPHQDDEVIGCGGAMALQRRAGKAVTIVMMNDGAHEAADLGMSRQQLETLRNEESRKAAAVLNVPEPLFLAHPSLRAAFSQAVEQIAEILQQRKVDSVFTPSALDTELDHRWSGYILAEALRRTGRKVRVLGYEVWAFCIPNVIVAIDDVINLKERSLNCFDYANAAVNYTWSTKGVNMFRSRLAEVGVCNYAECFFEIPAEEYVALMDKLKGAESSLPQATVGSTR